MDAETKVLRQNLEIAQDNLKVVTKKCRSLVNELENCSSNYDAEKTLRDQQLSRILRALLVLEAQLKQEQKTIRRLLQEKDNIIRAQQLEIAKLRRYTNNHYKSKRDCAQQDDHSKEKLLGTSRFQFKGNNSKSLHELNKEEKHHSQYNYESFLSVSGIQKKYSFTDSDISKTSLTSSEITDISNATTNMTTTTDNSSSLLSTEGFCEGESTDASPDSTLMKIDCFSAKATVNMEGDKSEDKCDLIITNKKNCSKIKTDEFAVLITQDALRNKISDDDAIIIDNEVNEEKEGEENKMIEPIYENICMGEYAINDEYANGVRHKYKINSDKRVLKSQSEEPMQEETNNHWYSDPDEDRVNDDVFQNTIYQSNSNHNSVLECVNQILLRDMEDEENTRVTSRRYKYKGKVVCFQTAKLSDIESVGSEVERRNSEDMMDNKSSPTSSLTPEKINTTVKKHESELDSSINLETTRIIHDKNNEDALSTSEEAKALVIIEPKEENIEETIVNTSVESTFGSCYQRNETKVNEKLPVAPKRLAIAKNLDYEDIESLSSEISCEKTPLQQKPQFRNNTLILKKIPSPSFLIDESQKKYPKKSPNLTRRTLYEEMPNAKKSTFNQLIYCQPSGQNSKENLKTQKYNNKDNNIENNSNLGHFEEFKIEESENITPREKYQEFTEVYDVQQNFEEFKLDECDLSDDLNRLEADGSEMQINTATYGVSVRSNPTVENKNNQFNSCYDNFLEASGMSNKSILTPSRLISNHKSMLKPKDIKYKRKIKASGTIFEGQDTPIIGVTPMYNIRHWTGPFV